MTSKAGEKTLTDPLITIKPKLDGIITSLTPPTTVPTFFEENGPMGSASHIAEIK